MNLFKLEMNNFFYYQFPTIQNYYLPLKKFLNFLLKIMYEIFLKILIFIFDLFLLI